MNQTLTTTRILSIDLLRGIVMIIMALDHARDYLHYDAFYYNPTDLSQTHPFLFFTRFITHVCAPVFVFLAGTSAFLVSQKRGVNELSIWLLKRGVWLIIAEFTIVKFCWLFSFTPTMVFLGVIWVIGASIIVLAGLIHLPKKLVIVISLIGVFGHNALDGVELTSWPILWQLLHVRGLIHMGSFEIYAVYPLIPWVFVMSLGYYFGQLFTKKFPAEKRKQWLLTIGFSSLAVFAVLRGFNIYGDLVPWESQKNWFFDFLAILNVSKYPPSLMYLLVTLGPALIFLAVAENWKGKIVDRIVVFGRVPMFYYILHIFLIHAVALIAAEITGFGAESMILSVFVFMSENLKGFGFSLLGVYIIWAGLIIAMYPICHWYNQYKQNNRDKWWLSYL